MKQEDQIKDWVAYCLSMRKTCQQFEPEKAIYYLTSPYLSSRQVGDAVMRKLGLPSLQPFLDWSKGKD